MGIPQTDLKFYEIPLPLYVYYMKFVAIIYLHVLCSNEQSRFSTPKTLKKAINR